jgi:hypothetical protein
MYVIKSSYKLYKHKIKSYFYHFCTLITIIIKSARCHVCAMSRACDMFIRCHGFVKKIKKNYMEKNYYNPQCF